MLRTAPVFQAVKDQCPSKHRVVLEVILREVKKLSSGLSNEVSNLVSELLTKDEFTDEVIVCGNASRQYQR